MTTNDREIHLIGTTPESSAHHVWAFENAGLTTFRSGYLPAGRIFTEPGFDALYLSLAAAERWNVHPVEDVIQLVETTAEDRQTGWPRYLLVGLALSRRNRGSPEAAWGAWARAILDAVSDRPSSEIRRVKVPAEMFDDVRPDRLARILSNAEVRHIEAARLKREIADLAASVLAGSLDVIDGAQAIERKRMELDEEVYEPLQGIRAFAEQTADYARRPEQRALWAPETLARFDETSLPYIESERAAITADLEALVRDFGRARSE
jgi:hypothetical protein